MRKALSVLVFGLLLLATVAFAGVLRDGTFSAVSNGNNITLHWISDDESGVVHYELERKAGINGQFLTLAPVVLHGNNFVYEYVDDSAFRITESVYQYQLKVVFANGSAPVYYGPITVRHDVSSVRKTWGSIKAMFR